MVQLALVAHSGARPVSVYIDNARIPYGRMRMCHMAADTTVELLAMADRIGVKRRWLQQAGTPREHFDVCLKKRAAAIAAGAIEVGGRYIVRMMLERDMEPRRLTGACVCGHAQEEHGHDDEFPRSTACTECKDCVAYEGTETTTQRSLRHDRSQQRRSQPHGGPSSK